MVLFESTHTRNEAFHKEIYFHHYYKNKFYIVLDILMVVSLLINLLGLVFDVEPDYTVFACFVFFVLIQAWSYRRAVKVSMAREREVSSNGEIMYTVAVCDNTITHKSSIGSEYTIEFSSIKKAYTTKNYIVLQSVAKQLYILKKDGFAIGNCEDFLIFLRGKGYKV